MPFIDPNLTPNPTVLPAAFAFKNMKLRSNTLLKQLVDKYKADFDWVWDNVNVTPTDALAAMGTSAVEVFTLAGQTAAFINTVAPGTLSSEYLSPPQAVTFHEDGTVTLA